ncbi:MAG: hypothetical protein ACRDSG_01355 [Pseudonocardiaceae bacterium]
MSPWSSARRGTSGTALTAHHGAQLGDGIIVAEGDGDGHEGTICITSHAVMTPGGPE